MHRRTTFTCALLACVVLSGADTSPVPARALNAITPEALLNHIRVLSSDEFEGRAPATPGEQKSLDYIIGQCKAMKLSPGNPDDSWLQPVSLWGITAGGGEITVKSADADFPLAAQDYRVTSSQPKASIGVADSPIVFAGYGIVAPEYKWDDYKGIDVKGKAVMILPGDPPVPDPSDPAKLDPKMFLGPELSFYGRAGSKADIAFAHGATAVITLQGGGRGAAGGGAAGVGRGAARGGANVGPNRFIVRESMIVRDASSTGHIAATVSLNNDKATELLAASGQDLAALREAALSTDFKPVQLKASIAVTARNEVREVSSANVVAKIEGSDPELRNEYVIYSGHWDHLGRQGENIFHGASDNASGVAGVLELAHAFALLPSHPKRTVIFLFTTAEERGLLGAKYYVQHPLYPLAKTVANINLDYFSNWGWGKTKDFSILGMGMTSLDDLVKDAVARQGRVVTGDTDPVEGFYWRSDHVEFAMGGVPSLASSPGIDYVGKPADYGDEKRREYISNDYHKPTDQIKSDWDLTGAVEDLQVLLEVGYRVAQSPVRPVWRDRGPYMYNPHAGK
ncbi:MAG: M20/M25/M40 family metallo-hydrolase [Bryobacteraceae bacterium]|jgi:Zn-dependent M28 family amino/carboxypeptidase